MRVRPLLLRDVLLLTIGALMSVIIFLVAQSIYTEWQKLDKVQTMREAALLGDRMFDAAEKISVERDVAFSILHTSDKESLQRLQTRLIAVRKDVDDAMDTTGNDLRRYNLPALAQQLEENKARLYSLQRFRRQIDEAAALPVKERDPHLSEEWFSSATQLIQQTQDVWMQFIKYFDDIDAPLILGVRFKHVLGFIMEYTGRQRALIGRLLTDNTAPTPQDQAQLLEWQGMVEMGWSLGNTLADQAGLYPALAPYFDDAKSHYLNVYDMTRDIFYVPRARHGTSYPISVEFWLDLAGEATDSLNTLKEAALKQTRDHVDRLETQARQSILYHSILLFFALGLCFYSLRVVIYRVIRPIRMMVEALVNASEGKPAAIDPPSYSRQDEIGKLAFVLHTFQQNAEEVQRTSAALGESENKLRQSQKMEAIGNLTGGMAHDFNNLLGVIIGNLDLLIEQVKTDEGQQQLAQSALDASLRGADLTRRLLAFARQQPLQPQRIDINNLVEGITKLLARMLGENIEISLNLGAGIFPVTADPSQLEAAITNLAANARDAMPKGGKLIITTLNDRLDADYAAQHEDVHPGDYAVIEVSDSGTGMPPEVVNRIFEPFFTTKERGKGTGLGLAMVFGFMKQSGGHINVYSEVGSGTTFRLYLPQAAASDGAAPVREAVEPRAKGGNETLLVVEDNEAMRKLVTRQLGELGYRVLKTANAADALEVLADTSGIDLVFTDIVMPGKMDGTELARIAMKRWPKIKVVLTSGFPENKLNGQKELIDGIRLLCKPYRKEQLASTIREVLDTPHK